jgi:hypothetical protein
MLWVIHVVRMRKMTELYTTLIRKSEARKVYGRFKIIGQNGLQSYPSELLCADTGCIRVVQVTNQWHALFNTVIDFPVSCQE